MVSALDVRENTMALVLAILSERFLLPEYAWQKLENPNIKNFLISDDDKRDILKMRDKGMTYTEIQEIYGIDRAHICRIVKKLRG